MSALPHSMPVDGKRTDLPFRVVVAAMRDAMRCGQCGKTKAVMNVAGHGRPFRAERVDAATHCACVGGPAYVAPATTIGEVCEFCGEERSRVEFYGEPCRGDAQPDGVPGPITGEHSFVIVELAAPALESDE